MSPRTPNPHRHEPSQAEVRDFLAAVEVLRDEVDGDALRRSSDRRVEFDEYRTVHAYRLWRSLDRVSGLLSGVPSPNLLELGAMPYFFTALLLDHLPAARVTGVNLRTGRDSRAASSSSRPSKVSLGFGDPRKQHDVDIHIFNVEHDPFPFSDGIFDAVLCMELIEHLTYSPTHMLAEAHRVLKPGGLLFLSTPNAVDMRKTASLLLNRSAGFRYSGYGMYGRHNREFTLAELRMLVKACGYHVLGGAHENILSRRHYPLLLRLAFAALSAPTALPLPYFSGKREYLFLWARTQGRARYAFPSPLYQVRHLYPDYRGEAPLSDSESASFISDGADG